MCLRACGRPISLPTEPLPTSPVEPQRSCDELTLTSFVCRSSQEQPSVSLSLSPSVLSERRRCGRVLGLRSVGEVCLRRCPYTPPQKLRVQHSIRIAAVVPGHVLSSTASQFQTSWPMWFPPRVGIVTEGDRRGRVSVFWTRREVKASWVGGNFCSSGYVRQSVGR